MLKGSLPQRKRQIVRRSVRLSSHRRLAGDCNRVDRAGRDTGTAAGTLFSFNFRDWAATQAWREANGAGRAEVFAGATFDAACGQTAWPNQRFIRPSRLSISPNQGVRLASGDAVAAKSAFATFKINRRKAAITADDNLLRAGTCAVVTAGAGISERGFR